MKIVWFLLAIFLPFITVLIKTHNLGKTLIALLLTLLGWIPGAIYAVYIVAKSYEEDPLSVE